MNRSTAAPSLVRRKCGCSGRAVPGAPCSCSPQEQFRAAPEIVQDVIRSPGRSLDSATRHEMEVRFNHDFSGVRIHSDGRAAESARMIGALGYTVGNDIALGAQYDPATVEGRSLLTHELAHVTQSVPGENAHVNLKLDAPDSPREREADRIAASIAVNDSRDSKPATTARGLIQRQLPPGTLPGPAPTFGKFGLSIDERGRVSVVASGPEKTPVVSSPTLGIRHDPDGKWHLLVGGRDKVVADEDIPKMLRSALGAGGAKPSTQNLKVPTCSQLQLSGKEQQARFMTFDQYKIQQRLWHGQVQPLGGAQWVELTQTLFDALVTSCIDRSAPLPKPEPEKPQDLPASTLPPGQAYA